MPCNTRSQDKKRQHGHRRHQEKETTGNKNNKNKASQSDEFQAMMLGLEKHRCSMSAEHKMVKQERDSLCVELVLKEVLCAHPMMRKAQGQDQGGGGGVGRSRLLSLDEMATSWLETFAKYSRKAESSTLIDILRRLEDDKKQQAKKIRQLEAEKEVQQQSIDQLWIESAEQEQLIFKLRNEKDYRD
ncbi:hypothetical protein BGX24_003455 [Mortierella sp. AD032]|nr:hypothetical protein BGX24_003455 [Mortierella sp. AD032]